MRITRAERATMRRVFAKDKDNASGGERSTCEWFALCDNEATTTEPHPILGDVPICGRCKDKLEGLK